MMQCQYRNPMGILPIRSRARASSNYRCVSISPTKNRQTNSFYALLSVTLDEFKDMFGYPIRRDEIQRLLLGLSMYKPLAQGSLAIFKRVAYDTGCDVPEVPE